MEDFSRIDDVVDELYAALSGPAGSRDLERELRLHHPQARLMRSRIGDDGRPRLNVMSVEEWYADTADFLAADDFYEIEVARHVERFGSIAWVRSVYEARRHPDDPELLFRGVNSIQVHHDGERWWIVSVLWDNEREGVRVPEAWRRPEAPG
jgi:hypothetical protein